MPIQRGENHSPERHRQVRICLVEDHETVRHQLTLLLTRVGFDVVSATGSIREANGAILRALPDIAVIDHRLPDGLGTDLCRVLTRAIPHLPVIIHSGTLGPRERQEALEAGARAVITKSARGRELLDAITAHAL